MEDHWVRAGAARAATADMADIVLMMCVVVVVVVSCASETVKQMDTKRRRAIALWWLPHARSGAQSLSPRQRSRHKSGGPLALSSPFFRFITHLFPSSLRPASAFLYALQSEKRSHLLFTDYLFTRKLFTPFQNVFTFHSQIFFLQSNVMLLVS